MSSSPINGSNLAVSPVSPVVMQAAARLDVTSAESAIAAVELQRQRYQTQVSTTVTGIVSNDFMAVPGLGDNIDRAAFSRES